MNDFTREELFEIEKVFDTEAGRAVSWAANSMPLIVQLDKHGKEAQAHKLLDEQTDAWTMARMISTKAHTLQLAAPSKEDAP